MPALLLNSHVDPAKFLSRAWFYYTLNEDNIFYFMGSQKIKLDSIN